MAELIVIGGYPGAGKSTLITQLQEERGSIELTVHDFMADSDPGSDAVKSSKHWDRLIHCLRNGHTGAVADIQFITEARQQELRTAVKKYVGDVVFTWTMFRDQPERARRNIRRRGRDVQHQLTLVDRFRPLHHIPDGAEKLNITVP